MKTYIKGLLVLITVILTSCSDVIEVDVPVAAPRLVIEASIDWEKGTSGSEQTIKLSTSTPYFNSNENNVVTGAQVTISNDTDNSQFVFNDMNDGTYTISNFVPIADENYTLEVVYNGETYIAKETLIPVVDINEVYQSLDGGFDDEVLEVNVDFIDPVDEENYYFFKFREQGDLLPELLDISDEFTDGNKMNVFYEKEEDDDINQKEFEAGDIANIEFYGVSEQYSNYIRLLIEQYESVGDPFSTIPVALRGNCTNPANPDNYAYGYFRLSQVVKTSYTFQ
ncbi:DUF4249 domain-containing protein [Postechiella marina]|uniref:DUF4249 domain-containing protein n=1 Tax=Postechiella marina TaxID=943941 RepID=A0ABP8BZ79_9FLAO